LVLDGLGKQAATNGAEDNLGGGAQRIVAMKVVWIDPKRLASRAAEPFWKRLDGAALLDRT